MMKSVLGSTILEVLLVAVLSALIVAGAVGGFQAWQKRHTLFTHTQLWTDALRFARRYAQTTQQTVVICPSPNQRTCDAAHRYSDGWLIYRHNAHATPDSQPTAAQVLARAAAWPQVLSLRSNVAAFVTFNRHGHATFNRTFAICHENDHTSLRGIFLIQSGRLRHANPQEIARC